MEDLGGSRLDETGAPDEPGAVATPRAASGAVQSVGRTFAILEAMAAAGGTASLTRLSSDVGLPLPTIHRLVRTLVALGYVWQDGARHYVLGTRLIPLGEASSGVVRTLARPYLRSLMEASGESANLAVLEGDEVTYVAQVQSQRTVRMFTEVGSRVTAHSTATGKALLSTLDERELAAVVRRHGLPGRTRSTLTDPEGLRRELDRVRARGYAMDDQEHEVGVRCVAVPLPDPSLRTALSLSGPAARLDDATVARCVPLMRRAAEDLVADVTASGG